jgi:hypothetical protein
VVDLNSYLPCVGALEGGGGQICRNEANYLQLLLVSQVKMERNNVMNNALLTGVAALLIGGAGGYMAGNAGSEGRDPDQAGGPVSKGARTNISAGSASVSRSDRSRSFEEIMREPGKTRRLQSLMDFYADLDPAEFALEAEKLGDMPFADRMLASALLFSRWAEIAPQEAMAYTQNMGRAAWMVRPTIVSSWASSDPVGAAQYYTEHPEEFGGGGGWGGRGGTNSAGQIAGEWAKQDPDAALEWAQGLEGRDGSSAVRSVFQELANTDPAKAAEMASSLEGDQLSEAYSAIARKWGSSDWDSAEQWISSLPADQRDGALAEAIRGLSDNDPILASQQIANLTDAEEISDAVRSVARNWAQQDPAAAAEWLVGQESEDLGRPMSEVMSSWVSKDSAGALSFLDAQPAGELRDTAAQAFLRSNRGGDVQESLQIAESIQDDKDRGRSVAMTAMRWMADDKEAAVQYLQNSPDIDEEALGRIIERAEGGGDWGRGRRGGR